eukprot:GEMP01012808.1.p1 GENE.GEMP01012808.1~~GEMP01012808.1.p1  ORF type:complete len:568 (+),score=135.97 GEMP01012808.1:262-1965(+)
MDDDSAGPIARKYVSAKWIRMREPPGTCTNDDVVAVMRTLDAVVEQKCAWQFKASNVRVPKVLLLTKALKKLRDAKDKDDVRFSTLRKACEEVIAENGELRLLSGPAEELRQQLSACQKNNLELKEHVFDSDAALAEIATERAEVEKKLEERNRDFDELHQQYNDERLNWAAQCEVLDYSLKSGQHAALERHRKEMESVKATSTASHKIENERLKQATEELTKQRTVFEVDLEKKNEEIEDSLRDNGRLQDELSQWIEVADTLSRSTVPRTNVEEMCCSLLESVGELEGMDLPAKAVFKFSTLKTKLERAKDKVCKVDEDMSEMCKEKLAGGATASSDGVKHVRVVSLDSVMSSSSDKRTIKKLNRAKKDIERELNAACEKIDVLQRTLSLIRQGIVDTATAAKDFIKFPLGSHKPAGFSASDQKSFLRFPIAITLTPAIADLASAPFLERVHHGPLFTRSDASTPSPPSRSSELQQNASFDVPATKIPTRSRALAQACQTEQDIVAGELLRLQETILAMKETIDTLTTWGSETCTAGGERLTVNDEDDDDVEPNNAYDHLMVAFSN